MNFWDALPLLIPAHPTPPPVLRAQMWNTALLYVANGDPKLRAL